MIEYLTLAGVVLIGVGLALQGWFILDLNRRVTRIMAIALANTEPPSEQKISNIVRCRHLQPQEPLFLR